MVVGKIARIVSDTEVILSVGADDEVKEGMEFVIFQEGDHVYDPDTQEDLGAIEILKGRVKVAHVMPKMSLARTLTYQVYQPSFATSISIMERALGETTVTRRHTLDVVRDQVQPVGELAKVRVGDRVRSI